MMLLNENACMSGETVTPLEVQAMKEFGDVTVCHRRSPRTMALVLNGGVCAMRVWPRRRHIHACKINSTNSL